MEIEIVGIFLLTCNSALPIRNLTNRGPSTSRVRICEREIVMTRGDVFVQILTELSGEPKELISEMLHVIKSSISAELHTFDEEISDIEAGQLVDELMQEREFVLDWFLEGYRRFLLRTRTSRCDS